MTNSINLAAFEDDLEQDDSPKDAKNDQLDELRKRLGLTGPRVDRPVPTEAAVLSPKEGLNLDFLRSKPARAVSTYFTLEQAESLEVGGMIFLAMANKDDLRRAKAALRTRARYYTDRKTDKKQFFVRVVRQGMPGWDGADGIVFVRDVDKE